MAQLDVLARQAAASAHSPYSGLAVGAAVLAADGAMHSGCNVENASFGLTVCAERNAIAAAVAGGMRAGELVAVAVYCAQEKPVTPCGACRQVIAEFAAADCSVHCSADGESVLEFAAKDLLPEVFGLK